MPYMCCALCYNQCYILTFTMRITTPGQSGLGGILPAFRRRGASRPEPPGNARERERHSKTQEAEFILLSSGFPGRQHDGRPSVTQPRKPPENLECSADTCYLFIVLQEGAGIVVLNERPPWLVRTAHNTLYNLTGASPPS